MAASMASRYWSINCTPSPVPPSLHPDGLIAYGSLTLGPAPTNPIPEKNPPMQNFEQIRSHVTGRYQVTSSEPYLIGLRLSLEGGSRQQGIFLAEIEGDDDRCYLRVSTAIAPITGIEPKRALQFNWGQRVGYLAISELDDVPYLHLCENRPYETLTASEVDRLILEIGGLGDQMERGLSAGGDLF